MNKYEQLTILSASLNDEALSAALKKYTDIIEQSGGSILSINKWGIKKFQYPISFKKEGHYVLLEYNSNNDVPSKINALMNIDENVHRTLCIKKLS